MPKFFAHPTAEVSEKAKIGDDTKIWHQAQVREKAVIGRNCVIGKSAYIDFGVKIGSRVKIQNHVSVYHGVTIEDDAFVGPSVTFTNDMRPRAFRWSEELVVPTLVKKGASIGANSTILCGITIGEYAMVGAGSVVTKNVPPHGLVFGNPAKLAGFVCECGAKITEAKAKKGAQKPCKTCGKNRHITPFI
jgi:acetyltransferase-like isoleucine patch superfamily enzyme